MSATFLLLMALFVVKQLIGPMPEEREATDWSFGGRPLIYIEHDATEKVDNRGEAL